MKRCQWAGDDPLMQAYHDEEWGRPEFDDLRLFEFLILESMQAGLSWSTILKKRENFRQAFANFDPEEIAAYDEAKFSSLMADSGIIRNRLKIKAAIKAAQLFLDIRDEYGSFKEYIWQFVGGHPIINTRQTLKDLPAKSEEAEAMSKALKKKGFTFVGPTICYAFMQAVGMVNDHTIDCFRYKPLKDSVK